MKKNYTFLMLGLVLVFVISSCQKENQEKLPGAEEIAQEDAFMEQMINAISDQVEKVTVAEVEAAYPTTSMLKASSTDIIYPSRSVEYPNAPQKWPRIITVDYGKENITVDVRRFEEVQMRGKVIIEKTAPYLEEGSVRTLSFDGFYFNDLHVGGEKVYTNEGENDKGNLVYSWVVDIKVTTPDHFWKKRKVRKERELIEGRETKDWKDNEFLISGYVRGSNSEKWEYNRTITVPLYRYTSYKYPVSGVVEVQNSNREFTIDYGDGTMDDIATITRSDGTSKEITLGRKKSQ